MVKKSKSAIFSTQKEKEMLVVNDVDYLVKEGLAKMQAIRRVRQKYGILTDATVFRMIRQVKKRKEEEENGKRAS